MLRRPLRGGRRRRSEGGVLRRLRNGVAVLSIGLGVAEKVCFSMVGMGIVMAMAMLRGELYITVQ